MSTGSTNTFSSGREASMARRKAMSQGKAGLPAAQERVRDSLRGASLPNVTATAPTPAAAAASAPAPAPEAAAPAPAPAAPTAQSSFVATGRDASIARRKAMSQGKAGLGPAKERVRDSIRGASMPEGLAAPAPAPVAAPVAVAQTPLPAVDTGDSCREIARKRRMIRAQYGRGDAPETRPSRPVRKGEMTYPTKVPAVTTAVSNATVTGLSYSAGRAMTGAEAGYDKPLTGTQYVAGPEGGYRASSGKVGHQNTAGGQTVSGTMVRSTVNITGDEDSSDIRITGNADQTLADDQSQRAEAFVSVAAQFNRQSQPHGQSVHGNNLGRSVRSMGSRSRETERPVEQTDGGHAVSGTAIGRSMRVTGDESGAARSLTGSQYLAPAGAQATDAQGNGRADPASGGKVATSQTWGGQTVTGPQMEHDGLVTGSEHGSCSTMTGTPYYGATAAHGWCDPETADREGALRGQRTARAITGNVPLNDPNVSGTDRGADRSITGSAYFVAEEGSKNVAGADMVSQSINGFSVSSPQRSSHLAARADAPVEAGGSAITGTFAQGTGKITGNVEFSAPSRTGSQGVASGRRSVTGQGSVQGTAITGSAWGEQDNVTGTEGYISQGRNPSERAGGSHGFAGAGRFSDQAPMHDQKSAVTGAVGWTPKSGAKVTLSGGAAG
ncbi:MAG: CsoS2 family carboxysome shell protein [Brevirhabdus sp.]